MGREEPADPGELRALPRYQDTIGAVLIGAKEAVLAPLRPVLRKYAVTEPQWRVMRIVEDCAADDATGIAEVGSLLPPSVSRILRELEQRKLIVRRSDAGDRRRAIITLSPTGSVIVRQISHEMAEILQSHLHPFEAARVERLIFELRALTAAFQPGDH